ncbi:MAG: hypothetical protein V4627_18645 [Pseudomonadota bacterium]
MANPSPVITAVRERLDRLHGEIPALELGVEKATEALEHAKLALTEMRREMSELGRFLENPVIDDQGSVAADAPMPKSDNPAMRAANLQIEYRTQAMLRGGKPLPTRDIYEGLLRQGVIFTAQNPIQRLSQILSACDWFVSDRVHGWSLKSEAPQGGTNTEGASDATMPDRLKT